jgi:hypothetical protein
MTTTPSTAESHLAPSVEGEVTTIGTEQTTTESLFSPSVEDQVAIGTDKILQSPHVSEGPGRLANAPVPSIYSDDRGEIHRLRVGGKRMNLLFSKESVMRSGYLHPNTMHDFVISGKVEAWTLTTKETIKTVYGPNQHFQVEPYTPHILYFLEDTVLLEWWEPGSFRCYYYHPYRRIVDVQNSLVSKSTGIFQRLVPHDEESMQSTPQQTFLGKVLLLSTGLIVGIAIGSLHRRK